MDMKETLRYPVTAADIDAMFVENATLMLLF